MRRALLIGINYRGTTSELNGCINDVRNVKAYLKRECGYSESDITVLTENGVAPTKKTILKELKKLLKSGAESMFLHYSGHGSHINDFDCDESDGQDECLVPLDFAKKGMITDDKIKSLLAEYLKANSTLFAVFDCCHSGSACDLPYNIYKRLGKYVMVKDNPSSYKKISGIAVMLSGCTDKQTSMDSYEEGQSQGALSYCFLQAMKEVTTSPKTFSTIFKSLNANLKKRGYVQRPNLSSTCDIDLDHSLDL